LFDLDTHDPDIDKPAKKAERDAEPKDLSEKRNESFPKRTDRFPDLKDFYNDYDPLDVTDKDREEAKKLLDRLDDDEKRLLKTQRAFYAIDFENVGGLIMPLILEVHYESGRTELMRLPAEIWRSNSKEISKLLLAKEKIERLVIDPLLETADADEENNYWPSRPVKSRFKLFKDKRPNAMQEAKKAAEKKEESSEDSN